MGLCKCPKKKCVVQSYIQWLQDSDYDPTCPLCQSDLSQEPQQDCVRLMCYDVFHWECLNRYAQQLPSNTAPAGYVCPKCRGPLFPASNVQSPVADSLRAILSRINWARAGLGLPLIQESEGAVPHAHKPSPPPEQSHPISLPDSAPPSYTRPSAQVSPYSSTPVGRDTYQSHSVVNMDEAVQSRGDKSHSEPRRLFDDPTHKSDHDYDKYKRRSAFTWLARWFSSRDGNKPHRPMSSTKRYLIIALFLFLSLLTLIVIFSRLGSYMTEDDPLFDPLANPNIRVKQVES